MFPMLTNLRSNLYFPVEMFLTMPNSSSMLRETFGDTFMWLAFTKAVMLRVPLRVKSAGAASVV